MKRNGFLLSFLILLLSVIYYTEELGDQKRQREEEAKSMIFNVSWTELREIRLLKVRFVKKQEKFWVYDNKDGAMPVDESRWKAFFERLQNLHVERVITAEERAQMSREDFFEFAERSGDNQESKIEFIFKEGTLSAVLGKKSPLGESFYMEIEKAGRKIWVLAEDRGPHDEIYVADEKNSAVKYIRLKSLLTSDPFYFYDKSRIKAIKDIEDKVQSNVAAPLRQ